MANSCHDTTRFCRPAGRGNQSRGKNLDVRAQLLGRHHCGFDGASVILAQAAKILSNRSLDLGGRFLLAETDGEIPRGYPVVPSIDQVSQQSARPAQSRNMPEREGLQAGNQSASNVV
jgi:hypothetical protein